MPTAKDRFRQAVAPFASLKLTIVLLAMSMFLIFAGTWAQVHRGIWSVMDSYFRSFYVWIPFHIFTPSNPETPGGIPFPGGSVLMAALLVNLLAAHAVRFKLRLRRTGIFLIHLALILLIVGEGLTAYTAVETQMPIFEGQTIGWAQDIRECELAVIDPHPPETRSPEAQSPEAQSPDGAPEGEAQQQKVVAIPESRLKRAERTGVAITNPDLPFGIRVQRYMTNSVLRRRQAEETIPPQANAGVAQRFEAVDRPEVTGVGDQQVNLPSAIITLTQGRKELGTYIVSTNLEQAPNVNLRQTVTLPDGSTRELVLRMRRYYKPYQVTLTKFHHDVYPGTQVPKNFASDIRLSNPAAHVDRDVKIYMNNPLRYNGETFYQASFMPNDRGTVLQVVDNPGWTIPYIACAMGALGLIIHFTLSLVQFFVKRKKMANKQQTAEANS